MPLPAARLPVSPKLLSLFYSTQGWWLQWTNPTCLGDQLLPGCSCCSHQPATGSQFCHLCLHTWVQPQTPFQCLSPLQPSRDPRQARTRKSCCERDGVLAALRPQGMKPGPVGEMGPGPCGSSTRQGVTCAIREEAQKGKVILGQENDLERLHGESGLAKMNVINSSVYFVVNGFSIIPRMFVLPPQLACELFESATTFYSESGKIQQMLSKQRSVRITSIWEKSVRLHLQAFPACQECGCSSSYLWARDLSHEFSLSEQAPRTPAKCRGLQP